MALMQKHLSGITQTWKLGENSIVWKNWLGKGIAWISQLVNDEGCVSLQY